MGLEQGVSTIFIWLCIVRSDLRYVAYSLSHSIMWAAGYYQMSSISHHLIKINHKLIQGFSQTGKKEMAILK